MTSSYPSYLTAATTMTTSGSSTHRYTGHNNTAAGVAALKVQNFQMMMLMMMMMLMLMLMMMLLMMTTDYDDNGDHDHQLDETPANAT